MDKTSTQTRPQATQRESRLTPAPSTINFLRQFARAYMPVEKLPGIVLN